MIRYIREHTSPPVFISSAVIALGLVLWGVIAPSTLSAVADAVNSVIVTNFGWLYIFSASGFLIFVVVLMASRFGSIRLGPADSRPEYGTLSWFAMLFTAGMGIGLVYYAVSEPVSFLQEPPVGPGGPPRPPRTPCS